MAASIDTLSPTQLSSPSHRKTLEEARYLEAHKLEDRLSHAVHECMRRMPADPLVFIASQLQTPHGEMTAAANRKKEAEEEPKHEPKQAASGVKPPLVDDGVEPNEWSLLSWTESARLHRVVYAALRAAVEAKPGGYSSQASFELVRGLKSREAVAAVLSGEQVIGGIVDLVWEAAQSLNTAKAATASQLNVKFAAEGGGFEMKYGDLSTFFGGLERKIGSPNPKIFEAMEREHTKSDDSMDEFTTGNYRVTTTSEMEWNFIVHPKEEPAGGWPVETILRGTDRAEIMRKPIDEVKLNQMFTSRNEELHKLDEPVMIWEEVIAGCAYTGPMFVK